MHNIDLNLLRVLAALYRTGNVTRAGRELGLSQSALSHALGRLRETLDDALFVRVPRGVVPTAFATSIRADVEEILLRADRLSQRRPVFDPSTAVGRLTVATTDYFELIAMPRLLPVIRREAPGVQLSMRPTTGELPTTDLEHGAVDLAIAGFYRDVPEGYFRTMALSDQFCTAVPAGVALRGDHPTVEEFYDARHALITIQGDFADRFARNGQQRVFAYGTHSFAAMAWVLGDADLWLTAPGLLLDAYARHFPIRVFPCPIDADPITVHMVWHRRTQDDPLRAWFRSRLKAVLSTVASPDHRGGHV